MLSAAVAHKGLHLSAVFTIQQELSRALSNEALMCVLAPEQTGRLVANSIESERKSQIKDILMQVQFLSVQKLVVD